MMRILALLVLALCLAAQDQTPTRKKPVSLPILEQRQFGPHDLARSANALIALGEEKAVKELESRITDWGRGKGYCTNERIGWLCRLLFDPRPVTKSADPGPTPGGRPRTTKVGSRPIRRPLFGALTLPYKSMPLSRWPKYPLAIQDGVAFVLSEGYMLGGMPEHPGQYIAHCRKHGTFRRTPFTIPDRPTASRALEKLLRSPRWKAIRWSHEEKNLKYFVDEGGCIDGLKSQVKRVPAK